MINLIFFINSEYGKVETCITFRGQTPIDMQTTAFRIETTSIETQTTTFEGLTTSNRMESTQIGLQTTSTLKLSNILT